MSDMTDQDLVPLLRRYYIGGSLPDFAADEIERLRAENTNLRNKIKVSGRAKLRARVAELESALRMIAGELQCVDDLMSNADIARAALEPKP